MKGRPTDLELHEEDTDFAKAFEELMKPEYILCSAIHFDDGKEHIHAPTNVLSGFIICGRRHHNCFAQIASLGIDRKQILEYKQTQGFLTNQDRFLDRGEALIVAYKAKQTDKCIGELFSEDLW